MKTFNEKVWELTKRIPKGKVSTYREIARKLKTKAYRAVGQALKCNPYAPIVPCHRVIASDGSLGGFGGKMRSPKKMRLLKREGVSVKDYRIEEFERILHRF